MRRFIVFLEIVLSKSILTAAVMFFSLASNASWADCPIEPHTQCPHAKFSGKDLSQANLRSAYLWEGDLTNANLSKADLREVNIFRGKLMGANFTEADMTGVTLYNANLTGANLTGTNLTGAKLKGANLSEADLTDAVLTNAELENVQFNKAIFCRTTMSNGIVNSGPNCPAKVSDTQVQAESKEAAIKGCVIKPHYSVPKCILGGSGLGYR